MKKTALILYTFTLSFAFAEPSNEAIQVANKLAKILNLKNQMKAGFDAMLPIISQQAKQLRLNNEEAKELEIIYREWFENDLDQDRMSGKIIALYAQKFTVEELEKLAVFYKTPLGKKTLKLLPEITAEGAKIGLAEAQAKQHLLLEKIKPFIEKTKK